MSKKFFYLLLAWLVSCGVVGGVMRHKRNQKASACNTHKACINDETCQCYCSYVCGFRDKTPDDRPVYVENDPNGKYCYCKQWDLDNYDMRECPDKEQ